MRILIIGGNGFIGRPLVRELLREGHELAVFHRTADALTSPETLQIQGDRDRLKEREAEFRAFAPEVIIDMILSSGKQAEEITDLASSLNARLVAVSSMDVYRAWGVLLGTEPGELEPMPITEDSPLRAARRAYPPELVKTLKNIFSWLNQDYDKVAVEQAAMQSGSANTVVRLPMVYGEGDPLHRMYPVVKRIADARAAIILPDDFAAWRGPRGYVGNVAHAIALAALDDRARGRIYHICEAPCLTEFEWQERIAGQMEWNGRFVILPRDKTPKHLLQPSNALQHVLANSGRIRRELGYEEAVPIDEAIRRTIAWEQANPPTGPSFHQFDYEAEDAALA